MEEGKKQSHGLRKYDVLKMFFQGLKGESWCFCSRIKLCNLKLDTFNIQNEDVASFAKKQVIL